MTGTMESNAMEDIHNNLNRRNFLKTVGVVGLGSVLAGCSRKKQEKEPQTVEPNVAAKAQQLQQVPKRKLGKTGLEVPILSLGTMFNLLDNQIILKRCLDFGVNCWDTSNVYAGGNSELGIGKFILDNPQIRKNLFIVTKALDVTTGDGMEKCLQLSLERMKTSYIDLHFFHDLRDPAALNDEIRKWAADAKKRKVIRFFGFSTHKNMAQCLNAAAKLDWIDDVMTVYNFRQMQDPEMQTAIDGCHKANIGLIAMKTQGAGPVARWAGHTPQIETDSDKKLVDHFFQKGFTEGQAKLKLIMDDQRFASVCVGMETVGFITENVAAALDKVKLISRDITVLKEYADATCGSYCAGCGHICDLALPDAPYVSDIMRYLMYYNNYGQKDWAKELFAQMPNNVGSKLLGMDYTIAEACCPQHLPIGKLVAEAVKKLA